MVIPAATAVGWVASPILKYMADKIESYLSGQWNFKAALNEDLRKLHNRLDEIQLALTAVKRQTLDEQQLRVLQKLRVHAEGAEELLDEFDYFVLKRNIDSQKFMKHATSYTKTLGKQLVGFDYMKSKLGEVLSAVDEVRSCANMLVAVMSSGSSLQSYIDNETKQFHATGSCHSGLIGRQKEVDMLVAGLIYLGLNKPKPCVISIVGDGGIGKTALAQLLYHDDRLGSHFDKKVWISISDSLDEAKYTKEIMRAVDDKLNMDDMNLSTLQETLQIKLEGKKLLLVLDDVWNAEVLSDYMNTSRWLKFLEPLKRSHVMILVTTRMILVARMLHSIAVCQLDSLSHEDSVALFEASTFSGVNPMCYPRLRAIGKKLVEKLEGYPLAIKVVASLLSDQLIPEVWEEVLDMNLSRDHNIMSVLRLSYDKLPLHLQRCFASCSLLPKNYTFDPMLLCGIWIAQGYVTVTSDQNGLEATALTYFNQLLSRSFFQAINVGGLKLRYSMHDHLNDLAVHVSEGEFLRVDGQSCPNVPQTVRHLCINGVALTEVKDNVLRRLKTLIIWPTGGDKSYNYKAALEKLRSIRSLCIIYDSPCRLPDGFGKCKHLRYLWVHNVADPIPQSIARLYHLQILCISQDDQSGTSCITFPRGIKNLNNILRLSVIGCSVNLEGGRHPYIRGSLGFQYDGFVGEVLCNTNGNKKWNAGWIRDMDFLKGLLAIEIPKNISSIDQASQLNLKLKNDIGSLIFQWVPSKKQLNSDDILLALQPSFNLEELFIKDYPCEMFPFWMSMPQYAKLGRIELLGCRNCQYIPSFGDLPGLRSLIIRGMHMLKTIGRQFFGSKGFPSLLSLEMYGIRELEQICRPYIDNVFPNIESFEIYYTQKLTQIPFWPQFRWSCTVLPYNTAWMMKKAEDQDYQFDEIMILPLSLDNPHLSMIQSTNKSILNEEYKQWETNFFSDRW